MSTMADSGERWRGEQTAQVRENTRRLDAINGQIDNIDRSQELVRSDVRSLNEKLDGLIARMAGIEQSQAATLQNVTGLMGSPGAVVGNRVGEGEIGPAGPPGPPGPPGSPGGVVP